jgi:murein DD-endopeptidase MepM/ murein hydrolase activator NlpD
MLAKLGCYYPSAWPGENGRPQGVDRHQEVASMEKPQAVVPEGRVNLRNYAQEQPAALGQGPPSPGYLPESNPLPYSFPLAGPFSFRDTWGDRRSGGRHHRAVDIFAREGTEVYAITSGVIQTLAYLPEAGITLLMLGQDGRGYGYMHLQGYAPGLMAGKVVRTGEVIGYVGRTGIRQGAAHLHFQVYADHRLARNELLNPYGFLVQLCHGVGVEDLHHHGLARLVDPEINGNRIQVYRRPQVTALRTRGGQLSVKKSSVLVIKNF